MVSQQTTNSKQPASTGPTAACSACKQVEQPPHATRLTQVGSFNAAEGFLLRQNRYGIEFDCSHTKMQISISEMNGQNK